MPADWSRRAFLRGGGAAVGLPLLLSLPRTGWTSADGFPLRFVVFTHGQGTILDAMVNPGTSETDFELGEVLAPLQRHKDGIVVVGGVDDTTNVLDTPYNGHTRCRLHTLTCQGMAWQADSYGAAFPWSAGGPSIDQVIADRWEGQTPYRSLEFGLGVGSLTGNTYTWRGVGEPVPPEDSPSAMFDRLFADLVGADPVEIANRLRRRQSVLDTVKSQFDLLLPKVDAEDRVKLEAHLESIRGLENAIAGGTLGDACDVPIVDLADTTTPGDTLNHIQMLTMALACDMTRVATLAFGGLNEFPWLDVDFPTGWHDAVHAGPVTPELRTDLITSYAWFAEQLAQLIDAMKAVPEGDGTLFDHTVILYANVFSTGASHDHVGKTYVLAGGGCGALQGGRYLDAGGRSNGDLFTSLLGGMGFTDECFGDPAFCTGPLPGVF